MIGFIFLLYAILLCWLVLSKKAHFEAKTSKNEISVSVIVAYRNESENLINLLQYFNNQTLVSSKLELVLVNDHSTDGGFELVEEWKKEHNYSIRNLNLTQQQGKKAAVSLGVHSAKNDLILCTDADCQLNPKWIETLIQPFARTNSLKMVLGPVMLVGSKNWFQRLQQVEFSTLMAFTILTSRRNRATMSNGANYSFRRADFIESNAYAGNETITTGDDIFLLHAFKKKYGKKSIAFVEEEEAVVRTKVKEGYTSFFHQRIRWASKSKNYKDWDTLKFGAIIFLSNFALLWVLIASFAGLYSFIFFIGCFLFKWLLDLLLLQQLPLFLRPKSIVKMSFLLSMVYPFYAVGIALVSLFYRPQWKGRKI